MAQIRFLVGPREGQEQVVSEDGAAIGRSEGCEIVVDDRKVSGEHAMLRRQSGRWWLYDQNSSNGTTVNGDPIEGVRLKDGDRIGVGDSVFAFIDPESADSTARPKTKVMQPAGVSGESDSSDLSVQNMGDVEAVAALQSAYGRMKEQLARVIVGQESVIEEVLIALFCRGHALLVGVPGLAKTLLVSTLSHVLDLSFKRIQFTPDLMPSDITGTDVLEEDRSTGKRVFRFVQGPVFANMVLADEINRTPPKTQAALLEAMQEQRVTVGNKSYHLPVPFFVLATQNPIEQEGTYPLPEAQLDRFMFNIVVDYPGEEEEKAIIKQVSGVHHADLEVVLRAEEIQHLQQVVRRIPAADHVVDFAARLARTSRPANPDAPDFVKEMVGWGAGPRAGIYLITAAKARAILRGRHHATTEDVVAVVLPVLRHRVLTTFNAEASGIRSDDIVLQLIDHVRALERVDA